VHNVAALRALVDPTWLSRIFLPYDGLLAHGRVVRDRAALADRWRVALASGSELRADFVVPATGSTYPFPAKGDRDAGDPARRRGACGRSRSPPPPARRWRRTYGSAATASSP